MAAYQSHLLIKKLITIYAITEYRLHDMRHFRCATWQGTRSERIYKPVVTSYIMDKIKQPEIIELRPLKRSYPVILLS